MGADGAAGEAAGIPVGERAGVSLQPWVEGAEPTARVEAAMEAWPHFPDEETEDTRPRSAVGAESSPHSLHGALFPVLAVWVGIEVGAWPQVQSSPPPRLLWEYGSLSGLRFSSLR